MEPEVTAPLVIVGLGPAGADRISGRARAALEDPGRRVIVRTLQHPAAAALAAARPVTACDDLYESAPDFAAVYAAIVDRVIEAARAGATAYAVPGSAVVGERTVALLLAAAGAAGIAVDVFQGESFLDLVYARVGVDPIGDGVQILDGRDLPDPLPLHLPTIITQVDRAVVLGEVAATLGRVLEGETPVTLLHRLGSDDESVESLHLADLAGRPAGPRTTLFVDPPPVGWHGLVTTNRRLRAECPWDRTQTHHSLVSHLVEEAYETVAALARLSPEAPAGDPDYGAYAEVEEELGDLLLQVVFHATLAAEAGAFDVEEVAEGIRRKLVHRHPHVFGDVAVSGAAEVLANWEHLKAAEKERHSLMDDIPEALPAISRADKMSRRAASVGFDWEHRDAVYDKVREELEELHDVLDDPALARAELGDLLLASVNLARHIGVDAELVLREAAERFAARFRAVELLADAAGRRLADMTVIEMDGLWESVKGGEGPAERGAAD